MTGFQYTGEQTKQQIADKLLFSPSLLESDNLIGVVPNVLTGQFELQPSYCHIDPGGLELIQVNATTFSMSAGVIRHNNLKTDIAAQSSITIPTATFVAAPASQTIYVYLKDSGTLEYRKTPPTSSDPDDEVGLGIIVATDLTGTAISSITPFITDRSPEGLALDKSIGGLGKFSGLTVTPVNGSYNIDITDGEIVARGRNWFTNATSWRNPHLVSIAGGTPRSFLMVTQDGTINFTPVTALPLTQVNTSGSTLTAVTGNNATIFRLYVSASGTFIMLYGQNEYSSYNVALRQFASENFVKPEFLNTFVELGAIIVRGDTTTGQVTNTNFWRFVPSTAGGGGGNGGGGTSFSSVTDADTTAGVLDDKIVVTGNISKSVLNPGTNEQLQFAVPSPEVILQTGLTSVATAVATNSIVIYNAPAINIGSQYNASTGVFIADEDMFVTFNTNVRVRIVNSQLIIWLTLAINGAIQSPRKTLINPVSDDVIELDLDFALSANDACSIRFNWISGTAPDLQNTAADTWWRITRWS